MPQLKNQERLVDALHKRMQELSLGLLGGRQQYRVSFFLLANCTAARLYQAHAPVPIPARDLETHLNINLRKRLRKRAPLDYYPRLSRLQPRLYTIPCPVSPQIIATQTTKTTPYPSSLLSPSAAMCTLPAAAGKRRARARH